MSKVFIAFNIDAELHLTTKGVQYELCQDNNLYLTVSAPSVLSRASLQFIVDTMDLYAGNRRPVSVEVFVDGSQFRSVFGTFDLD